MAIMYAPYIESTIPAFDGQQLIIPFQHNQGVSRYKVARIVAKIMDMENIVKGLVWYGLHYYSTTGELIDKREEFWDSFDKTGQVIINNTHSKSVFSGLQAGSYYKIQLGYSDKLEALSGNSNGAEVLDVKAYSTVGIARYLGGTGPTISITTLPNFLGCEVQYNNINIDEPPYSCKCTVTRLYSNKIAKEVYFNNKNNITFFTPCWPINKITIDCTTVNGYKITQSVAPNNDNTRNSYGDQEILKVKETLDKNILTISRTDYNDENTNMLIGAQDSNNYNLRNCAEMDVNGVITFNEADKQQVSYIRLPQYSKSFNQYLKSTTNPQITIDYDYQGENLTWSKQDSLVFSGMYTSYYNIMGEVAYLNNSFISQYTKTEDRNISDKWAHYHKILSLKQATELLPDDQQLTFSFYFRHIEGTLKIKNLSIRLGNQDSLEIGDSITAIEEKSSIKLFQQVKGPKDLKYINRFIDNKDIQIYNIIPNETYTFVGLFDTNEFTSILKAQAPEYDNVSLMDSNGKILNIIYNSQISSFKTTLQESKQDTIGGKYPIFYRNGNLEYKEFPIGGLISYQMDEAESFIKKEDLGLDTEDTIKNKTASEKSAAAFKLPTNNLVGYNITAEKNFRDAVLDWLNNGQPKIFRSPTEGIYLVRLLNVSLSPETKLGRMLYSFQATAYEIGNLDYETLVKYGFIKSLGDDTYVIQ